MNIGGFFGEGALGEAAFFPLFAHDLDILSQRLSEVTRLKHATVLRLFDREKKQKNKAKMREKQELNTSEVKCKMFGLVLFFSNQRTGCFIGISAELAL